MAMAIGIVTFFMMMMMNVCRQASKLFFDGISALHSSEKLCTVKNIPRSGYNGCCGVLFAQKRNGFCNLFLVCTLGMRKNNATRVFDLVIEEFTKVLHIHFALFNVCNGGETVQKNVFYIEVLNSTNNIRKLSNTRRLNQNAVGMVLVKYLLERFAKIANQRAANATAIHFGHFNTCILHKTAINADFAKFIFDQHEFFARISFF